VLTWSGTSVPKYGTCPIINAIGRSDQAPFRDVTADGFHWVWEASADDGATWESRWEIDYRRG
jgi:hypothetical protein